MTERARLHQELLRSQAFLEQTNTLAKVGGWELALDTNTLSWTRETHLIHGVSEDFDPNVGAALSFYPQPGQAQLEAAIAACAADGSPIDLTLRAITAAGERSWLHIVGKRVEDATGARLIGAIQDVTEQRSAVDALAQSEARYRRLFQHSLGLICTHTLSGEITSVNPAASLSLGRPEAELLGRSLAEIIPLERQDQLQYYLQRVAENQSDSGLMELVADDGSRRYWAYHNVLDTEADPPYVLGHAQDITTQHLQERQLLEMAIRDPLTRSFNRRYLAELAQQQLEAWGCLVFDLDHFKEINDTQGHAHGDSVLVEFVAFLSSPLEENEVVVRLGGDEFLVFVPGARMERLQVLEETYQARAHLAPVRFSGGCAISRPSETVADTINRADMKLYERRRRERPE
ncbi:sensor domain-containing diguanylate cyclase [Stenotrophomonas bentonitica]